MLRISKHTLIAFSIVLAFGMGSSCSPKTGKGVATSTTISAKVAHTLKMRTLFWQQWIDKCFPDRDWDKTVFETQGLDYATFKSENTSLDKKMRSYYSTVSDADNYLPGLINSGSSVPIKVEVKPGGKRYKIVALGKDIQSPSPYFLTESQLEHVKEYPSKLEQELGLPLSSVASEYAVYEIVALKRDTVFTSQIAPIVQYAKATPDVIYPAPGGVVQTLIINNMDKTSWTKGLVPIDTIMPEVLPQVEQR